MRRTVPYSCIAIALLALISSCASITETSRPTWITQSPAEDENAHYVVAYGSGATESDALTHAREDLRVVLQARLLNAIDPFDRQRVEQLPLQQLLSRRVAALESGRGSRVLRRGNGTELSIAERHLHRTADLVEAYLLVRYPHTLLALDARELTAPLRDGGDDAGHAATALAETSGASTSDDAADAVAIVPAADVPEWIRGALSDAERALQTGGSATEFLREALALSARLGLAIAPAAIEGAVSHPFAAPVTVQLRVDDELLPGSLGSVRYPTRMVNPDAPRELTAAAPLQSRAGRYYLDLPIPRATGRYQLNYEPHWYASLETSVRTLLGATATPEGDLSLLEAIGRRLRGKAEVTVTSNARMVQTALVIIDTDIAGNPIAEDSTARSAAGALAADGFRVQTVDLQPAARARVVRAATLSIDQLYEILPFTVLSAAERVVLGTARIVQFSERNTVAVVVAVEVSAVDLRRDTTLVRFRLEQTSQGSDARAAIRAAFTALGPRLAAELARRLP